MIISVEELRKFVTTDKDDLALQVMLEGLESFIRQRTHNDFVNRDTGGVEYPAAIKMAVVDIMRWKLRNEDQNSGDTEKMPVQSETISRHSVTYAKDSTESEIDPAFGVPKKYTSVFKYWEKARF